MRPPAAGSRRAACRPGPGPGAGSPAARPSRRCRRRPSRGRRWRLALDLPVDRGSPTILQYLAVAAEPWPGAVAVWRAEGAGPLALHGLVDYPACLGRTLSALPAGPLWRIQRGAHLDVTLRRGGALASIGEAAMLAGGNLFALIGAGRRRRNCSARAASRADRTRHLPALGPPARARGQRGGGGPGDPGGQPDRAPRRRRGGAPGRAPRRGRPRLPLPDRAGGARSGRPGLHGPRRHGRPRRAPAAAARPPAGAPGRARACGSPGSAGRAATAMPGSPPRSPSTSRRPTRSRCSRPPARPCARSGPRPSSSSTPTRRPISAARRRSLDVAVAQIGTVAGPGPACRARIPVRSA